MAGPCLPVCTHPVRRTPSLLHTARNSPYMVTPVHGDSLSAAQMSPLKRLKSACLPLWRETHKAIVQIGAEGVLCMAAVFLNDKELVPKKKKQHHAWRFDDGSTVEMSWDMFTPEIGNTVVVATGEAPLWVSRISLARQQIPGVHAPALPPYMLNHMIMFQRVQQADSCRVLSGVYSAQM